MKTVKSIRKSYLIVSVEKLSILLAETKKTITIAMSKESEDANAWAQGIELPRRVKTATVTSLAVSGVWLCLMTSLSLLYQVPLQPLLGLYTLLTPSGHSLHILLLSALSVWASVLHSGSYSVTPAKSLSVSSLVYSSLHPQVLLSVTMTGLQSLVTAWCFVKLSWPEAGEEERFLVGCGLWTGLYLGLRYCLLSDNSLVFPVIHKELRSQVTGVLGSRMLTKASAQAVSCVQYYYIASILTSLASTYSLPSSLSLSTALASLFTSAFIILVHNSRLALFSVFFTSPLPSLSAPQLLSLLTSPCPLIKNLALSYLARQLDLSASIRGHVFSLSQPGGHPTNWTLVSKVCLDTITCVTPSAKPVSAPPPATHTANQVTGTPTMRRLGGDKSSISDGSKLQDISIADTPAPQLMTLAAALDKFRSLGVVTDSEQDLLSVISSVDVMTSLVCASLAEDKFGVVQRDLSMIVTKLCYLDTELASKQSKVPSASVLRQAVKAGLYKVALQFGPHLKDIALPSSVSHKMNSYSKIMEA